MAKSEDVPEAAEKAGGEPSVVMWLILLAVMSLIAGGAGGAGGYVMMPDKTTITAGSGGTGEPGKEKPAKEPEPKAVTKQLKQLPPIIANLASAQKSFVRLEASIVIENDPDTDPDLLASRISEDILGVLRTLEISHLEGASGLMHLREDLTERVRIRSEGKVKEIILQSLVVE